MNKNGLPSKNAFKQASLKEHNNVAIFKSDESIAKKYTPTTPYFVRENLLNRMDSYGLRRILLTQFDSYFRSDFTKFPNQRRTISGAVKVWNLGTKRKK